MCTEDKKKKEKKGEKKKEKKGVGKKRKTAKREMYVDKSSQGEMNL